LSKNLVNNINQPFDSVVRVPVHFIKVCVMTAAKGRLQQAKRAKRGFSTSAKFISIALMCKSKFEYLQASLFVSGAAK
jgi:hypothetical protein